MSNWVCHLNGLPVTVDFTVTEPGDPGRTRGPVESCYEPEPPEIIIDGVQVGGIEIGPLLSEEILQQIQEQIVTFGGNQHGRLNTRLKPG